MKKVVKKVVKKVKKKNIKSVFGYDLEDAGGGKSQQNIKDVTGMSLRRSPFLKKMTDLEPKLFLKKKDGKFDSYSRVCPANNKRQPVILTNDATALDIRISASVQSTSQIRMYFRATSAEDARKLGDVVWTGFNSDGTSDSIVPPSKNSVEFKEHKFSVTGLPEFTAFELKVVLTGTNSSYPPLLKDMRGIALAV